MIPCPGAAAAAAAASAAAAAVVVVVVVVVVDDDDDVVVVVVVVVHRIIQKWLKTLSFDTFDLEMCFAPQRRAIFHLSSSQLPPHPPL